MSLFSLTFALTMKIFPDKDTIKAGAVLLVDKPYTWTSFDVIGKLRRLVGSKIGHAGTLDPLATGLLICCTGRMTKEIESYQKQEKEYTGTFALGATTPTFDKESEPENPRPFVHLTLADLQKATLPFTGNILQTPPIHSAIKKDGKRAYAYARAGVELKLEPRPVSIPVFEITALEGSLASFRVICSTGTYIRALANDFGEQLGCGAYLDSLRRTRIGAFSVNDAPTVDEWLTHLRHDPLLPANQGA